MYVAYLGGENGFLAGIITCNHMLIARAFVVNSGNDKKLPGIFLTLLSVSFHFPALE